MDSMLGSGQDGKEKNQGLFNFDWNNQGGDCSTAEWKD